MEQYAKIQQILKKEEGQKERKPIYPPTVIQAVFDAKTGASLEAILAQFNSIYVQYQGTPKDTRCIIPEVMRRAGLTITYMNMDSETITERAASAVQKDNDHWGLDINWSRVDELSLSGDISVSAQGTWIINGEDTGIKALGPKGDAGLTPWLKTIDNRLHFSYDNVNWEPCSEPIAAYFRFNATSGNTQSGTIGKIQISRDNKTWNDLSPEFTNRLHIVGYVATTSALPANKPVGTIYGVGPTYAAEDTDQTNPIYRLYVYNGTTWVDNGQFTSIAAGIVQETGDSETEVMSQKAVSEKLTELGLELGSEINRSSGKSIKSDIWCSFGAFNEKGVIEDNKKRLYIVLDKIKAISLSVNNDNVDRLQFCVYGNNEGLGYPVVKIRDFSNDDFTNNTEYQYLFVMVKNEDDSDFVESKLLHLICSDAIISASIPFSKIAKTPQYNDTRPIDSNSLFNINKSFFGVVSSFEDITNQVQFNEGHYINLKGDLVSNVSFSCSEMISTDGVSYVRLQSIVPNIGIAVLFFDEKGEKLLNESIVGRTISLEYHTYDFLIPSKATHFMVCGLTRDNYEIFIYKPNLISVQENLAYQDITELLDFTPNGFYEPDGDWASSTNWTTSKIYPTTNIKTIHASVCVNNALFAICYFDESKNLLLSESLIKQSEGLFEGLITSNIPYNAKYFAISSYIKNGYEPKVVVSTLSCIGNNNIFDWVDAKYTQEIDRAYLNNNGIETQIDASFFVSNYIDCSDINAVRYQGLSGTTTCQCIWYDENKNIIYPCKTVLTDIPNKIRQILYGKPNRAKYCRLSCKYDIFHKFEFSINRTISDVLNKSIVSNPNKNFIIDCLWSILINRRRFKCYIYKTKI